MKLSLVIEPGETVDDAARFAQGIAGETGQPVEFEFNSIRCVADPDGTWETLCEQWGKACRMQLCVRSRGTEPSLVVNKGDT